MFKKNKTPSSQIKFSSEQTHGVVFMKLGVKMFVSARLKIGGFWEYSHRFSYGFNPLNSSVFLYTSFAFLQSFLYQGAKTKA